MKTPSDAEGRGEGRGDPPTSERPETSRAAARRAAARKPRSKLERNLVWGGIAVLLVVLVFELRSYIGFKLAYDALTAAMEAGSGGEETEHTLTEADVRKLLKGREPDRSERLNYADTLTSRVDTYQWSGLLRTRSLYVFYGVGDNPDVIRLSVEKEPASITVDEDADTEKPVDDAPTE